MLVIIGTLATLASAVLCSHNFSSALMFIFQSFFVSLMFPGTHSRTHSPYVDG